jgi:hypothetical protein
MSKTVSFLGSLNSHNDSEVALEQKKRSIIHNVIFAAIFIVIFGLEFLYRTPLYNKSIEL